MDLMGPIEITIPEDSDLTGKEYLAVKTESAREALLEMVKEAEVVAFDIETWTDNPWAIDQLGGAFDPLTGFIAGMSFTTFDYRGRYLPISHVEHELNAPDEYVEELLSVLSEKLVVMHNAKFEIKWMRYHYDIELPNIADTMIMAHLIDPNNRVGLKGLTLRYLQEKQPPFDDTVQFNQYEIDGAALYACFDTDATFRLYHKFKPLLAAMKFLYQVEMALPPVVAKMESNGVPVDKDMLATMEKKVTDDIVVVARELWDELRCESVHGPFNDAFGKVLNSNAKLGHQMFEVLNLPVVERTKTGNPSVAAPVLKQLEKDYPVVQKIMIYKKLMKLRSAFLHNLPKWTHPQTGNIHCSFLQSHVPTGRFASKDPNMMQIPNDEIVEIRRAFVAPEGYRYMAFDYSQVEMRVFASEAKETNLISAFERGVDLHTSVASSVFGVAYDDVTHAQRQMAKTVNFGLLYGMQSHGLAYRIGVTEQKAQELIDAYFRTMPKARAWMDKAIRDTRKAGGFRTHFQRWRALPQINSKNPRDRAFGERSAVNGRIQGGAADIAKIAMVRSAKAIDKYGDKAKMVLMIHDDITFLVHESISDEEFTTVIFKAMEFPIKGWVPLKVDCKIGPSWGELEVYDRGDAPIVRAPEPVEPPKELPKAEYVALKARDDLTETDLEKMAELFDKDSDRRIEIVISGETLILSDDQMISLENVDEWNIQFGLKEELKDDSPKASVEFA